MDNLTLETYCWLTELDEQKAAEIISECKIDTHYNDTLFTLDSEESWDSYLVFIRVPGKFYKLIKKGDLIEEMSVIEDALGDISNKDHVIINKTEWTLRITGEELSSINDTVENDLIKELKILITGLGMNIQTNINSGIDAFNKRQYVNSVRLIYPSIEEFCNITLIKKGENPLDFNRFKGLNDKLLKLVQLNCINQDLVEAITITKPRNSVLHGQFNPSLNKLVHPLCISSITYLIEIIKAHNNN